MATMKAGALTHWELTEEEQTAAQVFTDLQLCHLQNERAVAADNLTLIIYDPMNPHFAGLQNAYFRGQMDILAFIMGISEDRKSELQKMLEDKVSKQKQG